MIQSQIPLLSLGDGRNLRPGMENTGTQSSLRQTGASSDACNQTSIT